MAGFAKLMNTYDISELELELEGLTMKLKKQAGVSRPVIAEVEAKEAREDNLLTITAPMVGTFYRAPAPDEQPYISVGDVVMPGQTVCVIEAMKIMNEIQSEVQGKVVEILVDNAEPVEYGQPLFILETV